MGRARSKRHGDLFDTDSDRKEVGLVVGDKETAIDRLCHSVAKSTWACYVQSIRSAGPLLIAKREGFVDRSN